MFKACLLPETNKVAILISGRSEKQTLDCPRIKFSFWKVQWGLKYRMQTSEYQACVPSIQIEMVYNDNKNHILRFEHWTKRFSFLNGVWKFNNWTTFHNLNTNLKEPMEHRSSNMPILKGHSLDSLWPKNLSGYPNTRQVRNSYG